MIVKFQIRYHDALTGEGTSGGGPSLSRSASSSRKSSRASLVEKGKLEVQKFLGRAASHPQEFSPVEVSCSRKTATNPEWNDKLVLQ
ncbi:hypothetical protein CYMTET_6742, partial [Cymbomonas tetramitiformis]